MVENTRIGGKIMENRKKIKTIKKVKTRIVITAGMLILSTALTACSNKVNASDYKQEMDVRLETIAEKDSVKEIISDINKLMNYRYEDVDIDSLEFISDNTKAQLKAKIAEMGDSEYYDITDLYNEYEKETMDMIAASGGTVDANGNITYPNGYVQQYGDDGGEEEVIDETDVETPQDPDDGVEQSEETISEAESTEETYTDYEEYGYATGKPPVGVSEDGYPIDEDGHVVIENDGEAGDPRTHDITDSNDKVVWEAVSEKRASQMTDEQNKEFLDIYNSVYNVDTGNAYLEWYNQQAQEQLAKEQSEAALENEANNDGDVDLSQETGVTRENSTMDKEYYTSTCVKTSEDGTKHYIEWRDILNGYDKSTGRFDYSLFGAGKYINFNDVYMPITTQRGNEFYKFELMDYRILDTADIKLFYESRNSAGGLQYSIEVDGKIVDGKFEASNIANFTDFYVK